MPNDYPQLVIVGYWSGTVPIIAQLSIASALSKFPSAEYHLFLDSEVGFEAALPIELSYLLQHPRFQIKYFSLKKLMGDFGLGSESEKPNSNLARQTRKRLGQILFRAKLFPAAVERLERFFGPYHNIFGFFWVGNLLDSIKYSGKAYRSDVFRIIIESQYRGQNFLYSDLDVYFSGGPERWNFRESFTYRGGESWANSAVLFLKADRPELAARWRTRLERGTPALPWHFFSDENCQSDGITVLACDLFDPAWSRQSVSCGLPHLFFQNSVNAGRFLEEIRNRLWTVHWHNQWDSRLVAGAPFDVLLRSTLAELTSRGEIKKADVPDLVGDSGED